jgi:BolA protein
MFRRYALGFSNVGRQFSTMGSATPLEDAIRAKVCAFFFSLCILHYLQPFMRNTCGIR